MIKDAGKRLSLVYRAIDFHLDLDFFLGQLPATTTQFGMRESGPNLRSYKAARQIYWQPPAALASLHRMLAPKKAEFQTVATYCYLA